MRSSPMQPSPFRSATSLALAIGALAVGLAGCSDDDGTCGTGGAPSSGLTASSADVTLVYGDLTFLAGNDCPDLTVFPDIISLSLEGRQTNGGDGLITLCIPRPDLLMDGVRTLGDFMSNADIQIIDLNGEDASGCTYAFDSTRIPTGGGTGAGVCDNGNAPAGFALSLDGAISLRRTCNGTTDTVGVTLVGRVAVTERP
ncbi:MAG: hypothetical protein SFX73_08270 [Kofleriaceae bacterium]|nr:hypothetical protein [Kofleriaceae bacterium]